MDERDIVEQIGNLTEEEHALESAHTGEGLSEEAGERRRQIEVALDQCWDLLRQRRARRDADQDPDEASVRPERVVEGYQQ